MILSVKNLNKKYTSFNLVDNSFYLNSGEMLALIGPNGCGKSTLLSCISDEIAFDSGNIEYFDLLFNGQNKFLIKRKIFYVPDQDKLDLKITIKEYLSFISSLFSIKDDLFLKRSSSLCKALNIDFESKKYISEFSHGMVKKVMLIASSIVDAKILIYDEPFNGLDAESTIILKRILNRLKLEKETSIIISSHNLNILHSMADKFILLNDGKIQFELSKKELDAMLDGGSLE